jgi:hypothetical protein
METLGPAIGSGDCAVVQTYLRDRHGIDLPQSVVESICEKAATSDIDHGWSDSSWDGWLRNRIAEIRAWPSGSHAVVQDATTAVLHVFFLQLQETEEMLRLLRHDDEQPESSVARSKIGSTPLCVHPVDAAAARVAPVE